jgi:hypothetical protein
MAGRAFRTLRAFTSTLALPVEREGIPDDRLLQKSLDTGLTCYVEKSKLR